MDKFIPYEKLSKKKKRELDLKKRKTWAVSPVTRRPENPRAYNRKKARKRDLDDFTDASFFLRNKSPAGPFPVRLFHINLSHIHYIIPER